MPRADPRKPRCLACRAVTEARRDFRLTARSPLEMNTARAVSRRGRRKRGANRKTKATVKKRKLSTARRTFERTLRVSYPGAGGRLVLRTEQDWNKDVEPIAVTQDGNTSTFRLQAKQPFLYFKPLPSARPRVSLVGRTQQTPFDGRKG
jgi:hypothetical protein